MNSGAVDSLKMYFNMKEFSHLFCLFIILQVIQVLITLSVIVNEWEQVACLLYFQNRFVLLFISWDYLLW